MIAFFEFLWTTSAILLIILVLLHSPKGEGGLASIGGQGQLFASSKSAEQNLNRVTWTVATAFLSISVLLGAGWLTTATGS
jgi:preprotein translocase subunit SecG